MPDSTLFLTGGTGLVGSHVAVHFRDRGWIVRALVRPSSDVGHLESLGCELVLGDVTSPRSLTGAAEGCEAVVHAAALVAGRASWEPFRKVNVEGTRHVLAECIRAGCPRFVHVSSVAVYGRPDRHPGFPIDESAPTDIPLGPLDHYERSKRMAEAVVRRGGRDAVAWILLRPAVVMGERDRHFTPRVANLAKRRILFTLGSGDNPLPVVYAGNVARACRLAATREEAAGGCYNVADDGPLTQRQLLREAAGDEVPILSLPRRAVRTMARLADATASVLPGDRSRLVTARRIWFMSNPNPFESTRIRHELGHRPSVSALEGWRRSLRWHDEKGVELS